MVSLASVVFASQVADPPKTKLRDVSFRASLHILITFKWTIFQGLLGICFFFSFLFSVVAAHCWWVGIKYSLYASVRA